MIVLMGCSAINKVSKSVDVCGGSYTARNPYNQNNTNNSLSSVQILLDVSFSGSRVHNRVESGSDDLDNLGHFLVGQVGLICKIKYLDVTRISHVL